MLILKSSVLQVMDEKLCLYMISFWILRWLFESIAYQGTVVTFLIAPSGGCKIFASDHVAVTLDLVIRTRSPVWAVLGVWPKLPLDPLIKREPAWSFRLHSISRFGQKQPTGVSVKINNRIPVLTDAENFEKTYFGCFLDFSLNW